MAHYAFIDENNIVVEVITGIDETDTIDGIEPEIWYAENRSMMCKRTSYNGNVRKNFAGIGYTYDPELDAFIPPRPDNAISFDEETCQWVISWDSNE